MKKLPVWRYLLLLVCYTFSAAGQSLCLKADIGVVAAWDSISLNLTEITGVRVGYFSILFNSLCILVWFWLLRKEFHPIRLLSIGLSLFFGFAVNFFYYDVFTFELTAYLPRLGLLVLGNLLLAVSSAYITLTDLISFPIEGLCFTLENKFRYPFRISRAAVDLFCILVSLALSLIFGTSLKIREGTVISMLMLGPIGGTCMNFFRKRGWFQ